MVFFTDLSSNQVWKSDPKPGTKIGRRSRVAKKRHLNADPDPAWLFSNADPDPFFSVYCKFGSIWTQLLFGVIGIFVGIYGPSQLYFKTLKLLTILTLMRIRILLPKILRILSPALIISCFVPSAGLFMLASVTYLESESNPELF